jgi:tetratricopeptide (TPR) repeat protein
MKKNILILNLSVILSGSAIAQKYDYGKTPEDSTNCVKNYSLYNEYFKQSNFTEAMPSFENTLKYCPKLSKSLYQNGAKMYADLIEKETDAAKKQVLIDKQLALYDLRIEHFGQKTFVLGRKGVDLYKFNPQAPEKAFEVLKAAFEDDSKKMEANPLYYLYVSLSDLQKAGKATKEDLFAWYPKVSAAIEAAIADPANAKTVDGYKSVQGEVDKIFSGIAECSDIIAVYEKKVTESPDNMELLKTATKLMNIRGCTESEFYFKAASKLHAAAPSEESAYSLGMNQKENCGKAIEFFKQAAELSSNNDNKAKYLLLAADCYKKLSQYSAARTQAQKALSFNPNLGKAYLIIGACYAASAGQCGDNTCTQKAAYWVAVDKFVKAKQVDPSLEEDANKLINTYSGYFPGKEDCFFSNINEGVSYTVECWINETTTTRFSK